MTARKPPNLREILAAAIAQLFNIPREHVKSMTAEQIISLVHVDHCPVAVDTAKHIGWTPAQYNHPSNLELRLIMAHRHKTATVDVPQIRKSDRVSDAHVAFRRRVLAKGSEACESGVAIAANKPQRKINSRPFQKPPQGHKWFRRK